MKRNEHTSLAVASWAARILGSGIDPDQSVEFHRKRGPALLVDMEVILSICGSVVTQTQDTAEREAIRKGKLPKGHRLIKRHKPIVRNGKARKR